MRMYVLCFARYVQCGADFIKWKRENYTHTHTHAYTQILVRVFALKLDSIIVMMKSEIENVQNEMEWKDPKIHAHANTLTHFWTQIGTQIGKPKHSNGMRERKRSLEEKPTRGEWNGYKTRVTKHEMERSYHFRTTHKQPFSLCTS